MQENRAFDALWEKDWQAKLGREEAEAEARKAMDRDHKLVLDQQVAELESYRIAERELAQQEAELLREQWELERQEAAKVDFLRRQVLEAAQNELHEFNRQKKAQLAVAVAEERQADLERLTAQLMKEKAEDERDQLAREAMQRETRLFAERMLAQKRAVESREAEIDAAQKEALDKEWEKRQAVWGQEREARERLMAQVLHERKIQVERKLEDVRQEQAKQAAARRQFEAELARINQLETQKLEEARKTRMDHRALLENQMKDKAFKRAAAEFNKTQEKMAAERAEAAYQAMLQEQMRKTTANMGRYSRKSQGLS